MITPSTDHEEPAMEPEPIPDVVETPPPAAPSSTPPEVPVHRALIAAVAAMPAIPKADLNESQNFYFRGIERIMTAAKGVLAAHGILTIPTVRERTVEVILVGRDQKPWRLVSLTVDWAITGPMGDTMTATTVGEGFDPGDKAASKAATMAFKSLLLPTLQIADGHDDADTGDRPEPSGRQDAPSSPRRTTTPPRTARRPASPQRAPGRSADATPSAPEGECPGAEVARVFGYAPGKVLVDARHVADQLGLPLPTRLQDVDAVVAERLVSGYQAALADGN